ncbi:FAD-dependent monooxygenase [Kineosporia succinea]|uniref:2-polyprenyl-6-methoxyphenol hydroxylase-like FAD-dependent oxidoreductase n=1 Tax=Kineosporia succinea TaxID=84632 RepID=A0ABT9PEG5_9ACTN|nr:FAD-dependent monooxygenase [Kineosporia succinea]MDP9831087.1 2-polyprenyl-6-methoxyphenol hydroxylase-like FAD-dependent oxidoreductase [Kineosporia succinea]
MFSESKFTVIVGAGPTGLTLARQLQRHGVPFRIVEKASALFDGSRGKGLQPRTLEVLDDLGVLPRFLEHGGEYPPMLVHRPDGETMTFRMDEHHEPTPSVPHPNSLMVPQWRTGQILAEGVPVEFGVELESLTQDDRGVHLTLGTGERVTARYVVGADGGRSAVRRALGVGFEGETREGEKVRLADVELEGLDREHWHVWPGADQAVRLGLCPLAGTGQFQLHSQILDRPLEELVPGIAPGVTVKNVSWTSVWRPNIRMASRFRVGNVFLAGDAAHVHTPAGGQGLNTGIQDAYNLGWKLATGDDALLDTYEAERLPVAAAVLGISTKLYQKMADRSHDGMRRDDPVLKQLSLSYRGGPLASEHRPEPGALQAGDRAPDAPLNDGRRVFDLLRGAHATLLTVNWTAAAPDLGVPVHAVDEAAEIYDVRGPTLLLVRPDNYLGCVTSSVEDVTAYLKVLAG